MKEEIEIYSDVIIQVVSIMAIIGLIIYCMKNYIFDVDIFLSMLRYK